VSAYHKNALRVGYRLAEYTIESVLGHGGFGITYLARDTTLGALVAIKEYLPHEIANRDGKTEVLPQPTRDAVRDYHSGLKNFVKEARALARFKHPNIVRVLRFLEANGTAYMVMEYEEGQSLADYLKREAPKLDELTLLKVFIPILNGLHAVHQAEMLHLDIKPENIYLRKDGSPMLIDFGSARQGTTHMQKVALTHGYAPMEQYPDKGKPGPWTDVYAVGASMYRCVTGKKPDDALERYQAILKYQVDPLTPAVKTRGNYQRQLLECIDWAIQVYPKDRPQSARELQDALMGKNRSRQSTTITSPPAAFNRPAAGRPKAVVPPPRYKYRSDRDSNSAAVAWMAAGLMVASLSVAGVIYWSDLKTYWGDVGWQPATTRATARPSAPDVPPRKAGSETVSRASEPARTIAPPSHAAVATTPVPSVLAHTLSGHQDWVQSVAFAPDSKWLASAGLDKTIKLWEAATGSLLGTLRQSSAVNAVAISPDGESLASAGDDGTVRLWASKTGKPRGAFSGPAYSVFDVIFSPDGKRIAAAGKDRTVFVWNADGGKRVYSLEGHTGDVYALAFSPDGKFLASAGADKTLRVWSMENGQEVNRLAGHKDKVLALAWSPDGKQLASGDAGQAIRVWDPVSGDRVLNIATPSPALSLAYSPDSRWLAAGLADNTIQLFDARDGTQVQTLTGHKDYVQSVAFSPNGVWLASASRDQNVKLWKAK
jgi:WD40 repeat protein